MSLNDIAQTYIAHVKEGRFEALLDTLYAEDAIAIEPVAMPGMDRTTRGLDALRAKSAGFEAQNKILSQEIHGPWPHAEDKFAVRMIFEMMHIESERRTTTDEIVVLTVSDGSIVKEEFFYDVTSPS